MDTLIQTIKYAGWGRRGIMQRFIAYYCNHYFEDGERLLGVGSDITAGKYKNIIFVTNKRVIKYVTEGIINQKEVEMRLNAIVGVGLTIKLLSTEIEVRSSNESIIVESIPLDVGHELVGLIRKLSGIN